MKSILQSLYDGEIFPEELIVSKDPEYRQINRKIEEKKEYFKKKLSQEDGNRLDELDTLYHQSSGMYATENFMYGFKLGAMIMVEIFTDKAELSH